MKMYQFIHPNNVLFWVTLDRLGLNYTYCEIRNKNNFQKRQGRILYAVPDTSRSNKGNAFSLCWKEETASNLGNSHRVHVTLWRVTSNKSFPQCLHIEQLNGRDERHRCKNSLKRHASLFQQQAWGEIIDAERGTKKTRPLILCHIFLCVCERRNLHVNASHGAADFKDSKALTVPPVKDNILAVFFC